MNSLHDVFVVDNSVGVQPEFQKQFHYPNQIRTVFSFNKNRRPGEKASIMLFTFFSIAMLHSFIETRFSKLHSYS